MIRVVAISGAGGEGWRELRDLPRRGFGDVDVARVVHDRHAGREEPLVDEAVRRVPLVAPGKEDDQAAVGVTGGAVPDVVHEETRLRIEQAPLGVDVPLGLRAGEVPRRMDVLACPRPAPLEDSPAVRVLADEEGTPVPGHAAARLRRVAVETGLPVGVVRDEVLPAVSSPPREEAELPVQVPAASWGNAETAGVGGVGIVEHHPGWDGAPIRQVRIEELALGIEDDVERPDRRLGHDECGEQ